MNECVSVFLDARPYLKDSPGVFWWGESDQNAGSQLMNDQQF